MYFGGCGGAIRHNNSNYVIIIIVVVTVVTAGIDIMFTVSSSNKTYGS
jgi:flagellar basal body-associated protein FliL